MSEVEVITACENVCRDFHWFFDFLSDVATNPIYAIFLGFGVSLLIWRSQTKLASRLDFNREKRTLYRDFISQSGKAVHEFEATVGIPWQHLPAVRRFWSLKYEITLIGSEAVDQKTKVALDAAEQLFEHPRSKFVSSDGLSREADENFRFELDAVIEAMKADLIKE
ncbi:hypothetical protein [Ruegeria atlantica]|uniref:hypothetical protein n=1 Tax=Ruegeria atlantica TaxID=81569 RepID=UPI0024946FC7|nr:hypothetical protein [Ruegeria atlantica]